MTVAEFLGSLRALDVQIVVDGDRLRVNAPAGVLSDAHRSELARRKGEIITFLGAARQLASQQRAIVPLESRGSRTPIFAVAGHNGDVFCYRALVHALGAEQPFYGLQPPGIEEGTTPLATIEDLAGYFAKQVRAVHAQGPLTIAGFCAGGTIAYELAQQLAASGADVRNLILFGAPHPSAYRPLISFFARWVILAQRIGRHARAVIALSGNERKRYFSERIESRRATAAAAARDANDPVMQRRHVVEQTTLAAIERYEPRDFPGHVDLMYPSESWTHTLDVPLRWRRQAATRSEFTGPEGCNGDNMLLPEYVATFAARVQSIQQHKGGTTS